MTARAARHGSLAFAGACAALMGSAAVSDARPDPRPAAIGDEILVLVRDNFVDAQRARDWAKQHRGYGAATPDWDAFGARTNQILAELGTSHTAFYPRGGSEQPMLSAIFADGLKTRPVHASLGIDVAKTPEGFFVRRVFPGGPGEAAGLLRGDRLVTVDGAPPAPSQPLVARAGKAVVLAVQREPRAAIIELRAQPIEINPKQEWLAMQRAGSRLIRQDGVRVGYHPMFSCAGVEHEQELRNALATTLASAAALVLDFRDGWGGCRPELVDLFSPVAPTVTSVGRDGKRFTSFAAWQRPLVLLINGGTRSGKEIVAHVLKTHHQALLVGERTAGAVMTGRVFALSDGSLLYLAVAEVLVDGQRLEGTGVAPDIEVRDALEFAHGKDSQLERALAEAAAEAKKPPASAPARD
jgi:carboxyl-terminal processing protease